MPPRKSSMAHIRKSVAKVEKKNDVEEVEEPTDKVIIEKFHIQPMEIPDDIRSASDDRDLISAKRDLETRTQMGENVIHCKACGVIPAGSCPYDRRPGAPCLS